MEYKKTGMRDRRGIEIECGHSVIFKLSLLRAKVIYLHDEKDFFLDFGAKYREHERFQRLGPDGCKPEEIEVLGHLD